jgi:GNAT superfamily N-acetyltransferase
MEGTAMYQTDKPDCSVRSASLADAPALGALLRGLGWFSFMNRESSADTERRLSEQLRLCLADKSHTVLVVESAGGAVLGYVAVHWLPYLVLAGPEGYVSDLFVTESARGAGLGTRLLREVEALAVSRGCSRLMLVNRKTRDSYKRGFYRKLGWEEREDFANFVLHLPRKRL